MRLWQRLCNPLVAAAEPTAGLLQRSIDLLFPPQCSMCRADCSSPLLLCEDCRAGLIDRSSVCPRCAADVPAMLAGGPSCVHCRTPSPRFQATVRLGRYDGPLRSAILRIKHNAEQPLAESLARLLVTERGNELVGMQLDVVVPMPMHWARRVWRGMNNPDILAGRLARRLRLPLAPQLLSRRRSTRPQTGLTRPRRLINVRGAFQARQHADLRAARVLLVDDVMTTGATASEAARVLRRAGAAFVAVAVLARAKGIG